MFEKFKEAWREAQDTPRGQRQKAREERLDDVADRFKEKAKEKRGRKPKAEGARDDYEIKVVENLDTNSLGTTAGLKYRVTVTRKADGYPAWTTYDFTAKSAWRQADRWLMKNLGDAK